MRVSAKTDYALRVLVNLALLYRGPLTEPVSIRTLAESNDVPKRFLEHIMIEMRQSGWVRPLPGRGGGFILAKPPEEITMAEVVRHFEGGISPIDCVSVQRYRRCSQEPKCLFRRVLLEIRDYSAAKLERATLAIIIQGRVVTDDELMRGFSEGDGI